MKSWTSRFAKRAGEPSKPSESVTTTVVPSENPSFTESHPEKNAVPPTMEQDPTQTRLSEKTADVVPSEKPAEAAAGTPENDFDETAEYVTGLPLMIIVVGLCLAVLLVALVSCVIVLLSSSQY